MVAEQKIRINPLAGVTKRIDPPAPRRPKTHPGDHLRSAVDSVLADLAADAHPDPLALHRFDDTLRGALAWTAALGDTCQVALAVEAVRNARSRLDAKDADQAKAALLTARDDLRLPTARRPKHS